MTRNAPPRFHWRAFAPPGRVANWSRWTLGALDRHGWQSVHTVVALVFVLAGALHLWCNWRTFWFCLLSKRREPGPARARLVEILAGA